MREECPVRPPSWQEGDSTARSYSRLGCSRLEAIPGKELFQAGLFQAGSYSRQGAIPGWNLHWASTFHPTGSYFGLEAPAKLAGGGSTPRSYSRL